MWWRRRGPRLELVATPEDEARERASGQASLLLPVLAIVAANLVPLWCALFAGWELLPLVLLFWFEFVVVLLITAAHLALIRPAAIAKVVSSFVVAIFSLGGLATIFSGNVGKRRAAGPFELLDLAEGMLPQVLLLAAIHCVPFIFQVLGRKYRDADPDVMVNAQTGRMLVLVLTLIVGGIASAALGSPLWALVVLVLLKAALEVGYHLDPTAGRVA